MTISPSPPNDFQKKKMRVIARKQGFHMTPNLTIRVLENTREKSRLRGVVSNNILAEPNATRVTRSDGTFFGFKTPLFY